MTVTLKPASKHLTKAKLMAKGWMPYLSHILSSMRTYLGNDVKTMAVDDAGRLYVNEDWIQTLPVRQVAYVLLHEVLHVVLSHAKRRKVALPDINQQQAYYWNVAADLCIQQMLARHHEQHEPESGVKIKGKMLGTDIPFLSIPGLKPGMTTEAYYSVLWAYFNRPQPPQPKPNKDSQIGMPVGGGGDGSQPQDSSDDEQDQKPGDEPADEGEPQPLDPRECGSGSDGIKRDYEKPSRLAEQAMMESKLAEVEQRIEETESKAPGTVPGELKQAIKARLHPQPDPFDQLRSVVSRSVASPIGTEDHTYRRLNRRQPANIARLRGVVRIAPECTVILDTSGSMLSGSVQDRAVNAVAQGLRKVQRPRVVQFDTQVQDSRRIASMKDFNWCGGGGTDMTEAIEMVDKEHRPDAIVIITDGETRWPKQPTRARLIIALCDKPGWGDPLPTWAKVVRCYEEGPKYAG